MKDWKLCVCARQRRHFIAIIVSLAALSVPQKPGLAETPDDNDYLAPVLGGLVGAHVSGTLAGLSPDPFFGPAGELLSINTDVILKSTAAVLELPAAPAHPIVPNEPFPGSGSSANCVYRVHNNRSDNGDGDYYNFTEDTSSLAFIKYNKLQNAWGELGTPVVFHPQADVAISVSNRYLKKNADALFPEGRHPLSWRAETSINPVMDIALPNLLFLGFTAAEFKTAQKLQATRIARFSSKKAAEEWAYALWLAIGVAADAGLIAEDVSTVDAAEKWYEKLSLVSAVNSDTQQFTVWDTHPPYFRDSDTAGRIEVQDIVEEATDFGGIALSRVIDKLRKRFTVVDDCDRKLSIKLESAPVLLAIGAPNKVIWKIQDDGPYLPGSATEDNQTQTGDHMVVRLVQNIEVKDTQAPLLVAPASFARLSDTPVELTGEYPLGVPRVVDLADSGPGVSNDAPAILAVDRRHEITWTAVDAGGGDGQGNVTHSTQLVTIKSTSTGNTAPTADDHSAATRTAREVEIVVTGNDPDELDGRFDPLEFKVARHPANGVLGAPLYPYFIEDFRLSPKGEKKGADDIIRPSPLKHLANDFRLLPLGQHGTFLKREICDSDAPDSMAAFNGTIPTDFVYMPLYVHVDDDGFYYIRDYYWLCGETLSPDIYERYPPQWMRDTWPDIRPVPRLSKWAPTGELVAMQELFPLTGKSYPNDKIIDRKLWPRASFSYDGSGRIWYLSDSSDVVGRGQRASVISIDNKLAAFRFHGEPGFRGDGEYHEFKNIATDDKNQLIYELRSTGPAVSPMGETYQITMEETAQDPDVLDAYLVDMEVDSRGYLYLLDSSLVSGRFFAGGNRVFKYAPAYRDEAGTWHVGAFIGWMGSCTSNKTDANGVPYNACDELAGTSRGYRCTNEKCNRGANNFVTRGSGPGQFDQPNSLAVDPRDILYVADTENSRIQRFNPDGTFAGEAKSTGTGVNQGERPGFILGNMGKPEQITVNSNAFYVMEQDPANGDYFVHVFKTAPFYDVTDNSAKIKYTSNHDFQGTDTFRFLVDDGIEKSTAATVRIDVSRSFRPPEDLRVQCFEDETLASRIPCVVNEDDILILRLSSEDPDGFASNGGLDVHSFTISEFPARGLFSQLNALTRDNSVVYRYTPEADFNGLDRFSFEVSDGRDTIAANDIELVVAPAPDEVVIQFPVTIKAARGFNHMISGQFDDIDRDFQPRLYCIWWGDGESTCGPDWEKSGRIDARGTEISPQIDFSTGKGMFVAAHNYATAGNKTLQVGMLNVDVTPVFAETVASTGIEVIEATVVSAILTEPTIPVNPATPFEIRLEVTNQLPQGWAGLAANNTQLAISVPDGLSIVGIDPRCASNTTIDCQLGKLSPGESTLVVLSASIDLAAAREFGSFTLDILISDDGPKATAINRAQVSILVADQDEDGVIDVDDAFIMDARYSKDTDRDGLADRWEEDNGFDPDVADDNQEDVDGDGYTLLEEFSNNSDPRRAEKETNVTGVQLSAGGTQEDRFGQAIAGGDLDQDGYDDLVIGAWLEGSQGAAYISYGNPAGDSTNLVPIPPGASLTGFGRSIAVGDFYDNGYLDIAIASNGAISVYQNRGIISDSPDKILAHPDGNAVYADFITSGDLDNDNIADLLVSSQSVGEVHLYLSTRGGVDATPLSYVNAAGRPGDSLAVADIDGDDHPDLLVGAGFVDNGRVYGFLGGHNDWTSISEPALSFILNAPGGARRFGFSITSGADIGGDGIDDLVVGAYSGVGSIHVYDSEDLYWQTATQGGATSIAPGQTINGLEAGGQFGVRVAMGHLDSDAYADVVVGANRTGAIDNGELRIFHGSTSGLQLLPQVEEGSSTYDMLGYFVAIPGDLNGDGFNDVAGGAPDIETPVNETPDGGYVQTYLHTFKLTDPDEDGISDQADNCTGMANGPLKPDAGGNSQLDTDGDGYGNICDPDFDNNLTVDFADLAILKSVFFTADPDVDLNGDGTVDFADLAILKAMFFASPGPSGLVP